MESGQKWNHRVPASFCEGYNNKGQYVNNMESSGRKK